MLPPLVTELIVRLDVLLVVRVANSLNFMQENIIAISNIKMKKFVCRISKYNKALIPPFAKVDMSPF